MRAYAGIKCIPCLVCRPYVCLTMYGCACRGHAHTHIYTHAYAVHSKGQCFGPNNFSPLFWCVSAHLCVHAWLNTGYIIYIKGYIYIYMRMYVIVCFGYGQNWSYCSFDLVVLVASVPLFCADVFSCCSFQIVLAKLALRLPILIPKWRKKSAQ